MRIGDDADDAMTFIASIELVRDHLFAGQPDDKIAAALQAAREIFDGLDGLHAGLEPEL